MHALAEAAAAHDLSLDQVVQLLGSTTRDVYLNDHVFWRNIPAEVWAYTLGGYLVIKKWLSYRQHDVLGRDLRKEEVREVTNIARRITLILLAGPALDANYRAAKTEAGEAQSASGG